MAGIILYSEDWNPYVWPQISVNCLLNHRASISIFNEQIYVSVQKSAKGGSNTLTHTLLSHLGRLRHTCKSWNYIFRIFSVANDLFLLNLVQLFCLRSRSSLLRCHVSHFKNVFGFYLCNTLVTSCLVQRWLHTAAGIRHEQVTSCSQKPSRCSSGGTRHSWTTQCRNPIGCLWTSMTLDLCRRSQAKSSCSAPSGHFSLHLITIFG